MLVFPKNLNPMEFQIRYLALFLLFSVIGGFSRFWVGNLHKNIQLMLEFLKGPALSINDIPYDFVCNIAIYTDDTTLCCKCHQVSDLRQQLELASGLESNL